MMRKSAVEELKELFADISWQYNYDDRPLWELAKRHAERLDKAEALLAEITGHSYICRCGDRVYLVQDGHAEAGCGGEDHIATDSHESPAPERSQSSAPSTAGGPIKYSPHRIESTALDKESK